MNEKIANTLKLLPNKPGVYIMHDATGKIIYVGKAVILKNRVRSYFRESGQHSVKVQALVAKVDNIETIVTDSEVEALMLECNLIKKYRPRYNIMLKDDKTYPYLKITMQEKFPRLFVTRRVLKDGAAYYGPYADVGAMHETVKLLRRMFPIRNCRKLQERPCLQYHIKHCLAPCVGYISEAAYGRMIESIRMVLDGKTAALERSLKEQMQAAAKELNFEEAARARDQLSAVRRMDEKQKAVLSGGDMDIVGYGADAFTACLQIFFVRKGKLSGRKEFFLPVDNTEQEIVTAFLKQYYYQENIFIPKEILLSTLPEAEESGAIAEWLTGLAGHKVELLRPQRGDKAKLLALACENAKKLIEEKERVGQLQMESNLQAAEDLQKAIQVEHPLGRMECFDISHIQGAETVASMVVFKDGASSKSDYRRYKLLSTEGKPDDFKSMQEVVYRRYKDYADLPDLIIIDGGKGQLSSALEVIRGLGLKEIPVIGLAKREEEIFLEGQSTSIMLDKESAALHLIQRIRDEAHRFAITYHRKLRGKRNLVSILDHVEGIGPKRRQALWKAFSSLEAMKAATEDELAAVEGMNKAAAAKLKAFFEADVAGKKEQFIK
jgi:excinuclease ABC subunit C